jgi:nitroreductase
MEVGRVVERVLMQAAAFGLVGVPVNEFDAAWVSYALIVSRQEEPLCLLPVGRPAQED